MKNIYASKTEKFYFFIMTLIGLASYCYFFCFLATQHFEQDENFHNVLAFIGIYIPYIMLCFFLTNLWFKGYLVSQAVKITDKQFPEYHEIIKRQSSVLGLKKIPEVYLLSQGGFLNAFAMRLLGKNVVVLYTSLLEHALKQGPAELEFIIAHELGHVQRKHTSFWWNLLIAPAKFIPFLGKAYSRACEYTCDGIAHALAPSGSEKGLLILVTGKGLIQHVDVNVHLDSYYQNRGWATWFFEISSTHPIIPKRILALREFA